MPHTITTAPSDRRVSVELGGEPIAESDRVLELHETNYPTRYYLPLDDVRKGVLEPSEKTSRCPYKGRARYWSARVNGELHPDVAWSYPDPIADVREIAGLVAFYPDKVAIAVD